MTDLWHTMPGILALCLVCSSVDAQQQLPRTVNMVVAQDGLYLDGKQVTDSASLTTRLQILSARRPQPIVYVSGQQGVSSAAVAAAVNACVSAGLVCPTGRVPGRQLMGGQ